jgi:Domain of unknown function DUF29
MEPGPAVHIKDDFYAWLLDQAAALRERRVPSLDWENLAEELEAMAASERRELVSHLRRLLSNLLKWTYSAIRRSERSWDLSIAGARSDLSLVLASSKTLRNELPDHIRTAYKLARSLAGREMRLDKYQWQHLFPEECPWTVEQLLDEDFLPPVAPTADGRTR